VLKNYWEVLFKAAPFGAFLVVAACLALSPHDLSGTWSGSASRYLLGYLCISFAVLGFIRWYFPRKQNLALVFCSGIFLFVAAGFMQVLSVIFVVTSCGCLGLLIKQLLNFDIEQPHFIASTIIGATIYILLFNALISTPVHYQLLYVVIFSLPIIAVLRSCALMQLLSTSAQWQLGRINNELQPAGRKSFFTFILVFTCIAAYILFPTVNSDENSVHLAVWTQFNAKAFFNIAPEIQIWSAAPITLALAHGILSLLSGADAKGALNLLLLLFLLGAISKLLRLLDINRTEKLALVTLFLSTPLLAFAVVGLQTDLFLALMLCTGCALLIDLIESYRITTAIAVIFVGALALSSKLPAVTIAGCLFIGVIYATLKNDAYKNWSHRVWIAIVACLLVGAAVAFLPYIRAYMITGNPVFPLYNAIFKSEFADATNFKDLRWTKGATLASFKGLFFDSESFVEADNNFVGGFQYFLLAPIALATVILLRIKHMGLLLLLSLCYLLPLFFSLQYLRYFFAAMPLLSVLIGLLYLVGKKDGAYRKWLSASLYATTLINFIFLPGICWIFFVSPFSFLSEKNREQAVEIFMPEQQLNREINKMKANPTVLFAINRAWGATLSGQPIYNAWGGKGYRRTLQEWGSVDELRDALKKWHVDFVYWDQKSSYKINDWRKNLIRDLLSTYGKPVIQNGAVIAFTIADSPISYHEIFSYNNFPALDDFRVVGAPQIEGQSIKIGKQDVLSKSINLSAFNSFKYSVEFSCEAVTDSFVAHIDFGNGDVYYKLLNCHEGVVSYTETGLIPVGTRESAVALSVSAEQPIRVHKLSLAGH